MKQLLPQIKDIAKRIERTETKRRKLASFLTSISPKVEVAFPVEPGGIENLKVAGVDGGLLKRSLHGFDCVLMRAAAACFTYSRGRVDKVDYIPSRMPVPEIEILEALSDLDWSHSASIARQKTEVRTVYDCIGKFGPDILLMDGPILPHYADRPSKESPTHESYQRLLDDFRSVYRACLSKGILLAGVIEDSRDSRFCNYVKTGILSQIQDSMVPELMELLDRTRDTNILYWVLKKGERSMLFPYSEKPAEHPVLKDLEEFSGRIHCFYLKTAQWDRPVKVDFLAPEGEEPERTAERLSAVLLSISGHHSGYGLPAPLIEADNIAKLSAQEMDDLYSQIAGFAGAGNPGAMRLRRDDRPF